MKAFDDYTIDQFGWLRRVASDTELPAVAARIAITLLKYFSRKEDGWAWMSQQTLANDLGVGERTVRGALSEMVKRGHLECQRRGQTETNRYRSTLDRQNSAGPDRQETAALDRKKTAAHEGVTGKNTSSDRQNPVEVTGKNLPTNTLKEHTEEHSEEKETLQRDLDDLGHRQAAPDPSSNIKVLQSAPVSLSRGTSSAANAARVKTNYQRLDGQLEMPIAEPKLDVDGAFEQWWQLVPRKVAKAGAAKIFGRILKKREATLEQLTAGMIRHAAEMSQREERFIPHPTKWLNEGRWADEPVRQSSHFSQAAPSQSRHAMEAWAIARQLMEQDQDGGYVQ